MIQYPPADTKVQFIKAIKTDDNEIICQFKVMEDTQAPNYYRKGETLWWEISAFDWALPQTFFDRCTNKGLDPLGNIVWCYDDHVNSEHIPGGKPLAITPQGHRILYEVW